jgi:hypothetical protein
MSGIATQGWDEFIRLRDEHIYRIRRTNARGRLSLHSVCMIEQ